MSDAFDATKHLRQLRGKGGAVSDYLEVKWRLVWLRSEHPDAITKVEHVEITPDVAIFKALVVIPGQGRATDYGSETPRDFGDYIEKAATKALGRALAQLGYGTQFVGFELDENTRIVDSPVERRSGDAYAESPHPGATAHKDGAPVLPAEGFKPARPAKGNQSAPQPPGRAEAPAAAQEAALPNVAPLLEAAWRMVEDGKDVGTVWNHLSAQRKFLNEQDWATVKDTWKRIKAKLDERDAAEALRDRQPASIAG